MKVMISGSGIDFLGDDFGGFGREPLRRLNADGFQPGLYGGGGFDCRGG